MARPRILSNPFPTSHSPCNRASLNPQGQQTSAYWVAHVAPITSHIADLEWRECEGRAIATSSHHTQDNLGTLCTSGFRRPAEGTQEGRPDGAAGEILREIESAERCPNWVEAVQGVRGCPKPTPPKSAKYFEILVSAEGFEPSTHALKGSSTQLQTRTCTSSLLHARHNKIKEIQTRHRSGCPEGARNPASRTMSLRFAVPNVTRRIHFAEPFSFRFFRVA